jgi:hypothetical protein
METTLMRFAADNGTKTPAITASTSSKTTPTLINTDALLIVRAEPLADLSDSGQQEREQRVIALIQQADV